MGGLALRIYFRNDKFLFADISKIILSIINEYYNETSETPLKTGAIISYQSFGDIMRSNPHFHSIILEGGIDCEGTFYSIPIIACIMASIPAEVEERTSASSRCQKRW